MKKTIKRNLLGALTGVMALVGGIAYYHKSTPREKTIPSLVQKFPSQIPGAKEVRKYEVPGAKYCLIHILQKHEGNFKDAGSYYKSLENPDKNLGDVQEDIYSILSFLIDGSYTNKVYVEGVTDDVGMRELTKTADQIISTRETIRGLENLVNKTKEKNSEKAKSLYVKANKVIQAYYTLLRQNAHLRLYSEGKILVAPADFDVSPDQDYNALVEYAMGLYQGLIPKDKQIIMDEGILKKIIRLETDLREDAIMQRIVSNNDDIGVVVFGGKHAWGGVDSCGKDYPLKRRISLEDNISKWNQEYPDKKFSLIEVVPQNYSNN